jgi:hypothetical protein
MDEILGVMDALGACRKETEPAGDAAAASCSAGEQQGSSTAADTPLLSESSERPSSSKPVGSQQLHKQQLEQQQNEQAQVQEQYSPSGSPRGSSQLGRPTRASMLSSKVPAGKGPVVSVKPAVFSFDAAHPGLADKHYLRTKEQDRCHTSWFGYC